MANIDINTYTCQAVSGEIITGEKPDGTPKESVGLKLRVVEGPSTGMDIFWYGSLSGGAAQYTMEALRNCGWTCNDITALEGLGSLKVNVVGKADEYNGKVRQKWSIYPVRVPAPRLEADAKASFAERFKALAIGVERVKQADANAAGPLPEARVASNGTGGTKPTDGPVTSGVQF